MSEDIYKTPSTELEKSHDGFICPSCKTEMINGYATSNHDIYWRDEGEKTFMTVSPGERLSPKSFFRMGSPKVNGYRCKDCNITILCD